MEVYVSGSKVRLRDQSQDRAIDALKYEQFKTRTRIKEANAIAHKYECRILEFRQARHDARLY